MRTLFTYGSVLLGTAFVCIEQLIRPICSGK